MSNLELLNKFYKEDFIINIFYKLVKSGDDFSLVYLPIGNGNIKYENILKNIKNIKYVEWMTNAFIEFN